MFKIETKNRKYVPFDNKDEYNWNGKFYFIQCADSQLGMLEKCMQNKENPGCDQEIMWCQQLIQDVNAMEPKPKFVVMCGDLLDAFPETEQALRDTQMTEFIKVFNQLKIPLVCVCGNHDVGNQPTYKSIENYRSNFGDDYFSFWCGGVFFIVLNSQLYEDSTQVPKIAEEHAQWLDRQIKICGNAKHTVVFQHIPYFLSDPDEGKDYFNIEINLRKKLLENLYCAGIRYIFTGHYHRNAGGFYKDLELIVTSAVGMQLGEDQNGFRIVKVLEDKLEHKYYELGKSPTNIVL